MTWLLGCSSGNVLLVDVQTNVRSADFDAVEVEFSSGSTTVTSSPLPASAVAADLSSTRVAEFAGLPSGVGRVVVRFVRDGGVVAVGQAEFALNGPALVTVVVAQECNGVTCPGEGRVCVGGRCADPRCTPESAEFCPAPLCEEAADCPAAADCNSNVCVVGACLSTFGGICDAGTADAGSPDAGPPDAGPPPESRPADSRACQPMCAPPSGRRVNGWLCTGRVFYANFEFRQATCVAGRCVDETEVARLECVCNDGTPEPECDGTPGCESLDARSGCDDPDVSGGRIPCPFVGDYRDPGCFPE